MRTRTPYRACKARLSHLLASLALALPLAGCLSSDGSSDSTSGQRPDPVMADFPIAYVERPVSEADAMAPDVRDLLDLQPGGDLYMRDRASPSAPERNVTGAVTEGKGDVRDVEPSYDGKKAGLRVAQGADPGRRPRGPAEMGYLGIRPHDAAAAPGDSLGHRRRRGP